VTGGARWIKRLACVAVVGGAVTGMSGAARSQLVGLGSWEVGGRVRFRTARDTNWRYGMLNRTRTEPPCYMVLLFRPSRTYIAQVPIDSATGLQRSTMFGASRDYDAADTTTHAGERWVDVPRDSVTNAVAACRSRRR